MDSDLMTLAEVAKYLKVSESTLHRWRREGIGPPLVNLNERLLRYDRARLREWVKNQPDSVRFAGG